MTQGEVCQWSSRYLHSQAWNLVLYETRSHFVGLADLELAM